MDFSIRFIYICIGRNVRNYQNLILTMATFFEAFYVDCLNDKDNSIVFKTFRECDSAFHALNDIYKMYFT